MTVAQLTPQPLPLAVDDHGVIRVGGTRVPLERVVGEWKAGASAEAIVESFPTLDLADVYVAIGYYLHRRGEVEAYLAEREADAARTMAMMAERFPQEGLRERLLARLAS